MTKQYFKLPFRCYDVNMRGRTGYSEDIWPMLDKKKMVMKEDGYVERPKEIGQVDIFTINFIVEEKYQKMNDKIPKRKKLATTCNAYSTCSDNDGGIFVSVNSLIMYLAVLMLVTEVLVVILVVILVLVLVEVLTHPGVGVVQKLYVVT